MVFDKSKGHIHRLGFTPLSYLHGHHQRFIMLFLKDQDLLYYLLNVNWLSYLIIAMISSGAFTIWSGDASSNFSLG